MRFAVEDLCFANESNADALAALPLAYCTPAWGGDNAIAGGHLGTGGITPLGKTVLKKLCRAGIAIDTAHLNPKSFYECCDNYEFVLNSHTCLKSICNHSRNLDNAQIRALIGRGGVVGITCVNQFMRGEGNAADIADFVEQLDSYAQSFGVGSLAVGTDFMGTDPVKGLESYGKFDDLAVLLAKIGFSQGDTEKIFYTNARDYFEKIPKGRR
jgi:membrane dipeptidase